MSPAQSAAFCGDQEDTCSLDGMRDVGAALDRLAAVIAPKTGKIEPQETDDAGR